MRDIQLPDGRILTLTGNETPEQLSALKTKLKEKYYSAPDYTQEQPSIQSQTEEEKTGLARTIFDQAMQGSTMGWADDISDRLGVVGATLRLDPKAIITGEITNPALIEEVANARRETESRLERQMKERPVTSIASNLAGNIATLGAGSGTKAGIAAGNFLRSGNTAIRAAKGLATGLASGAVYGAGAASDEDKAGGAGRGAIAGAVTGFAAPVLGKALSGMAKGSKNIGIGIMARGEDALNSAAESIKNVGTKAYERMRQTGATFTPSASNGIAQRLGQKLAKDGPLNPRLHDKVLAVMDDITENGFDSLEQLDQWRQVLRDIAGNFNDKVNQRKALLLIDAIDDEISNISPQSLDSGSIEAVDALLQGRDAWARRARFETVANIVNGARGDANKLKRDLDNLRLNKKKTAGWSKEELSYLKDASTQTTIEGIMKMIGKFGFDLGSGRAVGNTALPGLGAIAAFLGTGSAGPAAIVPAVGTAARYGQKALASGKAENLLRAIERGENVTQKQIMALPPKEAMNLMAYIRSVSVPAIAGGIIGETK